MSGSSEISYVGISLLTVGCITEAAPGGGDGGGPPDDAGNSILSPGSGIRCLPLVGSRLEGGSRCAIGHLKLPNGPPAGPDDELDPPGAPPGGGGGGGGGGPPGKSRK